MQLSIIHMQPNKQRKHCMPGIATVHIKEHLKGKVSSAERPLSKALIELALIVLLLFCLLKHFANSF